MSDSVEYSDFTLLPSSIEVSVHPSPHVFCPVGGIHGQTSIDFDNETRCLLHSRLRVATLIILGGFAAFLVRNFFIELPEAHELLIPHVGVVLVLSGLVALLFSVRNLTVLQLRSIEVAAFLFPAVFFVWMQYYRTRHCPTDLLTENAHAFPGETLIPWLILIQVYGFFIPNTWRRATAVILGMSIAPLLGAWGAADHCPHVAAVLYDEGRLSAMILWMSIGAAVSIIGAHRNRLLRREAFDAKRFGVYTLREKLGSGGMGEVYIAEHQLLKRRCAIKLIKPEKAGDPKVIARFESEVRSAAALTHPNTIEIYDYGITQDGTFYYVMEYLPGLNLQELVERYGPMPPERVVHLLTQVCSALTEAHDRSLIHRDIKPGNIFAAERGGVYDIAKLLDFGLVKLLKPDAETIKLTHDGAVVGSPLFAAPEAAIDGEPDERSDIYSIGATAYFLLSGRPVFPGTNPLKVLFAHSRDEPQPLHEIVPDVPPDLEAVILRCLAKEPDKRYQTATELQSALEACRLPSEWTQDRAREWWSQTPIEEPAERQVTVSTETEATAVMPLRG